MAEENKDIEQKIKLTYETNAEELAQSTAKLADATNEVATSQESSAKSTKLNTEALKELNPNTSAFIQNIKGMTKAALSFIATPLGAILAAIAVTVGVLIAVFKSFQPLMDKVEQVVDGVGAAFNVVKNTIVALVTGTKSLTEAFSGLGGEMSKAYDETTKLTKAQQDLEDAMASQEVATARNRAVINRLNVELRNRTKTDEERLRIADEITKREKQDFDQRRKLVGEELRLARKAIAIKAQFSKQEEDLLKRTGDATKELAESRGGNYDEEYKRLNAARLKAISLEDEVTVNLEKTYSRRDKIEEDRQAKIDKANSDAKAREEKARAEREKQLQKEAEAAKARQAIIDTQKSEEEKALQSIQDLNDKTDEEKLARQKERDLADIERLKQKGVDVTNLLILNEEKYATLEDELAKKRSEEKIARDKELFDQESEAKQKQADEDLEAEKARLEAQKALEDAKKSLLNDGFAALKDIFGKNKKIQKAILIAENATALARLSINTVDAISKDNAASPLTFGAPWSIVHGAQGVIGAASIISATTKGLQALGGGSAGGTSSNAAGGQRGSASATPQVSFQASSENQIATSVAGRINEQPPLKVYVTESDITQTQSKVKAQVSANTIG